MISTHISWVWTFCVVVGISVTGCSNSLELAPAPGGTTTYCIEVENSAPVSVADQLVRETNPGDSGTVAWGDPAITLRCGVTRPVSLTATSQLISINGIDWLPEELTKGQRFTSINTPEYVQVDVPKNYEPAGNALIDLAEALATS